MMIKLGLRKLDYHLVMAQSGEQALKILDTLVPDIILMDIQMPGIDGFETTAIIKKDPRLKDIPVLFLSALKDIQNIVNCYDSGGVDYISKPFRIPELIARIATHLKIRQLQLQLENEHDKMNAILHNMLPHNYVVQLRNGQRPKTEVHKGIVALFSDFKNFTGISRDIGATASINHLNFLFYAFDEIIDHFVLERVKTIGDGYFAISGINTDPEDAPLKAVAAMLKMQEFVHYYNTRHSGVKWELRVGAHVGDVITGIVGNQKIAFDVWGHTVNIASRLQSVANTSDVLISEELYKLVAKDVHCNSKDLRQLHHLGKVPVYSIGSITTRSLKIQQLIDNIQAEKLYSNYDADMGLLKKLF